jgi:hypothetical protein
VVSSAVVPLRWRITVVVMRPEEGLQGQVGTKTRSMRLERFSNPVLARGSPLVLPVSVTNVRELGWGHQRGARCCVV